MAKRVAEGGASSEEGDQKGSHLWSLLPSFDPSTDEIKEYVEKVRFLQGICPQADKGMLAPRLSMLCRGTAWQQVRNIPAGTLTDPKKGVDALLAALSSWEEISEMQTYEKFEKALFKVSQKSDEAVNSYVNRLQVAFSDLDDKMTVKDVQAFLLLRQSALSIEDKKKVLTMVNGPLTLKGVEKAMRALSTKILVGAVEKKKIYPANYVEPEIPEGDPAPSSAFMTSSWTEDEECDQETINYMANMGDNDATTIQEFERDLEEAMQEIPDLQQAMVTHLEARQRITEKKKSRQFWPSQGSFSGKSSQKGFGKKRGKGGGKASLLDRIARSFCKVCGKKGHWKAECPDREKEQANTAVAMENQENQHTMPIHHVIVEELNEEVRCGYITQNQELLSLSVNKTDDRIETAFVVTQTSDTKRRFQQKAKWFTTKNLAVLQKFYASKLEQKSQKNNHKERNKTENTLNHHRPNQSQVNEELIAPVCMMSSDGIKKGSQSRLTPGMAILDTGASRSVVGEDHVPWIIEQLPDQIRSMVKEKDSRVGFRFGNNQIEYSFKQLQIPLIHGKQRVWILIEVVPRATPFLISIHTMKCLRAVIDLESGSCFLKSIGRSIPICENRNGLMTLKIQDLCCIHHCSTADHQETHETCAAAFSEFKSCQKDHREASQSNSHADPWRNTPVDQSRSRGGHGEPPAPPPGLDEPIRDTKPLTGGVSGIPSTSEHTGDGGSEPKGSDRTTDEHGAGHSSVESSNHVDPTNNNGSKHQPNGATGSELRDPIRTGMGHRGARCGGVSRGDIQPAKVTSSKIPSQSNGGRAKSSSTKSFCTKGINGFGARKWTPISQSSSRTSTGIDPYDDGKLGKQEDQLGQKALPNTLLPSVRGGPGLQCMASSSSEPESSNERFPCILPSSGESRDPSRRSGTPSIVDHFTKSLCDEVYPKVLTIDNLEEANWMTISIGEKGHNLDSIDGPIDLLEIYASENSRLTEQVNRLGGKLHYG